MAIDYEKFIRSPYNTTINSVSSSVESLLFTKINERQRITESVQIQDWKYQDPAYLRPRYEGAKSTSRRYTFYTIGDSSYGKKAAIDLITTKFAWANPTTDINLNFFDKTSISIKYLIDQSGSLTELSRKNVNWYEVQNLFKSGDSASISLLDKNNPSNQAGLDGSKTIFESGYSYSPIVFRESNETLRFIYNTPKETTDTRLGIKVVSTASYVFQTVGNTDTNLTDTTDTWTYFKIDGVDKPGTPFSFNRYPIVQWPYTNNSPLTTTGPYRTRTNGIIYNTQLDETFSADNSSLPGGGKNYYTLDWFTPNQSGSAYGGYVTSDNVGTIKVNLAGGLYYTYYEVPRTSDYVVNLNVPIKLSYTKNPDPGPSVVRVVAIIERQAATTSNWEYVVESRLEPTNIPATYTNEDIGIDSANSSIYMDGEIIQSGNVNIQANCIIRSFRIRNLAQGGRIRVRFYFVEVMNFFRRSESIYFEIGAGDTTKSFFEIYDEITSQVSLDYDQDIIGTTSTYAMFSSFNDNTIEFDITSSLLYNNSTFSAPSSSQLLTVSDYYSSVESPFVIEPGDIVRFGTYFSIKPELYTVTSVSLPVIQSINNVDVVVSPLKVTFDKNINPSKVNSRSFAFLKKTKDETSIIFEYKKPNGISSNSLIIPYNLDTEIEKNTSNIINPIKDTILLKVLGG